VHAHHDHDQHGHHAGQAARPRHELSHEPRHAEQRSQERMRLWGTLGLSLLTLVGEAVGGWLTHSLALLSDAGHMLTDVSAIGLSILALAFAARPANEKKSFGYYRLEILAALTNGVGLIAISAVIAWEAVERLRTPVAVHVIPMAAVALFGLLANGASVLLLQGSHNMNVRGVWLHVLGDLVASAGVLIAAILMWATGWYRADPII
jgi:cobalt-zinc-cadmium efflux system protein